MKQPANIAARRLRDAAAPVPQATPISLIPVLLSRDIQGGDSLADVLLLAMREQRTVLESGDILVVKHKIISKAESRIVDLATVRPSQRARRWARKYKLNAGVIELALRESRKVIRQGHGVLITETRHGFICANSGVDASNVDGGRHALLLPADPDRSARELYREIRERTALSIPILVTDSWGRPWREGLVEFCIGIAGMKPLRDDRGRRDPHGYLLRASVEAVADELACAAGLVCGKLKRSPACIVRGFSYSRGAGRITHLLRQPEADLFR